jgi:ribosome-binding protein aMBF1 (putative translation factor)
MPYRDYAEDEFEQQWENITIKKESKKETQIIKPIQVSIPVKILSVESRQLMINKREELKLSQIALNTKCKFPFKYSIRDIESGKAAVNLTELRMINSVLDLNLIS